MVPALSSGVGLVSCAGELGGGVLQAGDGGVKVTRQTEDYAGVLFALKKLVKSVQKSIHLPMSFCSRFGEVCQTKM